MASTPLDCLLRWLHRRLPPDQPARAWLDAAIQRLDQQLDERDFFLSVGLAARKLSDQPLDLSAEERAEAEAALPGWAAWQLTVRQAGRLALVLSAAHHGEAFFKALDALWRTADVGEQVVLFRGLPLYPEPQRHLWWATNGCRTSIQPVFEAIAHHNPYPAAHFDEVAFNQLCLKALFVGSPLHPIYRLDERTNPRLARMMTDYAFERWAASRPVSPELWRCVGPAPDARGLEALARALAAPEAPTRAAAALACAHSPVAEARALLSADSPEAQAIAQGTLSWASLAQSL